MEFEWDEAKRVANIAKHGVDFAEIGPLFEGVIFEEVDDRSEYGEVRSQCIGEIEGEFYVVVCTWRGDKRRIISARKANAREKGAYHARYA